MSTHATDQLEALWQQQVGAARAMWGKLTEDELLTADGERQKLAGLIKERYVFTLDAADQQAQAIFDLQKSLLPKR